VPEHHRDDAQHWRRNRAGLRWQQACEAWRLEHGWTFEELYAYRRANPGRLFRRLYLAEGT
jgi:hypothetical protein